MKLQILIPQYKETDEVIKPLLDKILDITDYIYERLESEEFADKILQVFLLLLHF